MARNSVLRTANTVMRTAVITAGVTLLVTPLSSACSTDSSTEVIAVAPGAVADAAADVTTGRIRLTSDSADLHSVSELRFDGDDRSLSSTVEPVEDGAGKGGRPGEASVRSITVDGTTYSDTSLFQGLPGDQETTGSQEPEGIGGARWISQPTVEPPEGVIAPMLTDPLGSIVAVLRDLVIDRPGEAMKIDGVAATRYRIELSGGDASELMVDLGLYSGGDSLANLAERYSDAAERFEAVQDYLDAHSEATVVVDMGESDQLVQAEVTARVDVEEYPRCGLFGIDTAEVQVVLDEINEPQGIEAPLTEDVMTWEEFADRSGVSIPSIPDASGSAPPDFDTSTESVDQGLRATTDPDGMPTTTFGGPDGGSLPAELEGEADRAQQQMLEEMLAGCPGT